MLGSRPHGQLGKMPWSSWILAIVGSVSKVEMATPIGLISKVLFPSLSTFETPPCRLSATPGSLNLSLFVEGRSGLRFQHKLHTSHESIFLEHIAAASDLWGWLSQSDSEQEGVVRDMENPTFHPI